MPSRTTTAPPVSLADVADRVGVSPATVSRALHNPEKVAAATLGRIRLAIEELGYRPNVFAAGLMHRSARVLAVVTPDELDAGVALALRGAEDQARRLGYFLLLVPRARLADRAAALGAPALALVDGVVVLDASADAALVRAAFAERVPIVHAAAEEGVGVESLGAELVRRAVTQAVTRGADRAV
ncbi:MAG: LacI family DNA-binding transcriptional regulator [Phycisphaerales bacterium]